MVEFPVPLLTLLQHQSYLVPFISARIFIIPKLQNIYWRKLIISELFSLWIEHWHIPKCCSVRPSDCFLVPDWSLWEHLSRALPTETIFHLLQSIRSERLIHAHSTKLTLEMIINWLQVSDSECDWRTSRTKKTDLCLGAWFRATERLVRSLQG